MDGDYFVSGTQGRLQNIQNIYLWCQKYHDRKLKLLYTHYREPRLNFSQNCASTDQLTDFCTEASLGNALNDHGEHTQAFHWVSVFCGRSNRNWEDLTLNGVIRSLRDAQKLLSLRSLVIQNFLPQNPPLYSVL